MCRMTVQWSTHTVARSGNRTTNVMPERRALCPPFLCIFQIRLVSAVEIEFIFVSQPTSSIWVAVGLSTRCNASCRNGRSAIVSTSIKVGRLVQLAGTVQSVAQGLGRVVSGIGHCGPDGYRDRLLATEEPETVIACRTQYVCGRRFLWRGKGLLQ